jgi:hypothetical protein
VKRATYHERGAPPGPGKDLIRDGTMNIRNSGPTLDQSGPWARGPSLGPNATVDFWDWPGSYFELSIQKNGVYYDITGIAAQQFYFTAFAAKGLDGNFVPLKTFYWSWGLCEALPPGTDLSKPKTFQLVDVNPVKDCRSGSCDTGEPKFMEKINGPRGDACNVLAAAAWNNTSFDGPATYSINCGT